MGLLLSGFLVGCGSDGGTIGEHDFGALPDSGGPDLTVPDGGGGDGGLDGQVIDTDSGTGPDTTGPSIVLVNPKPGQAVGGLLEISAMITDRSGVADKSVIAVFGGDLTNSVTLTSAGGDLFNGFFDVRKLGRSYVLPSLSVRAYDKLGNFGELGIEVVIDNTPASLELDPPKLRAGKTALGKNECSHLYDPVGDESVNDGQKVPQLFAVKARIHDNGNHAPGLLVERYAGLEPASINLYALPANIGGTDQALNVDMDGDGKCDAINPLIEPVSTMITTTNQALRLMLVPLTPGGSADFTSDTSDPAYSGICDTFGETGAVAPDQLCTGLPHPPVNFTYVTPFNDPNVSKVQIFTIPPVVQNTYDCLGFQLDSRNVPEGPTCLGVVAKDKVGNLNVSPPIRVCIDRGGGKCNGWPPANLPDCTGTYDKTTNKVSNTPCTPLTDSTSGFDTRFPKTEVVFPVP